MSKTFKIVNNDISDGYHTFDELYDHRIYLYLALCRTSGFPAFYKRDHHSEWFCLFLETPHGQISYHLPSEFLGVVKEFAEEDPYYVWDNHTSGDVLLRLLSVIRDKV